MCKGDMKILGSLCDNRHVKYMVKSDSTFRSRNPISCTSRHILFMSVSVLFFFFARSLKLIRFFLCHFFHECVSQGKQKKNSYSFLRSIRTSWYPIHDLSFSPPSPFIHEILWCTSSDFINSTFSLSYSPSLPHHLNAFPADFFILQTLSSHLLSNALHDGRCTAASLFILLSHSDRIKLSIILFDQRKATQSHSCSRQYAAHLVIPPSIFACRQQLLQLIRLLSKVHSLHWIHGKWGLRR